MADPWSEAAIITLRTLHPEGASFGEMAKAISKKHGVHVSRSAVIGKANRLGLVRGHTPAQPGGVSVAKVKPAAKATRLVVGEPVSFRVSPTSARVYVMPPNRPLRENAGDVGTVRLVDLGAHHCRWPVGDPRSDEFRFCGAVKIDGFSYCGEHRARASAGLPPKKARAA